MALDRDLGVVKKWTQTWRQKILTLTAPGRRSQSVYVREEAFKSEGLCITTTEEDTRDQKVGFP